MVFNHNLTNDTFKSSKASNLMEANKSNDQFKENNHTNDLNSNGLSKVISLQTFYSNLFLFYDLFFSECLNILLTNFNFKFHRQIYQD